MGISNIKNWAEETRLETTLAELLSKYSSGGIKKQMKGFQKTLDECTALYHTIWQKNKTSTGEAPANCHFRWWLHLALHFKHNKFKLNSLKKFTKLLITKDGGTTTIHYKDDHKQNKHLNTGLSNLTVFTTIARAYGMDAEEFKPIKRDSSTKSLVPGYANSHIKAVAKHGNGMTVPEDAISNRERLNRDMTQTEQKNLGAATS